MKYRSAPSFVLLTLALAALTLSLDATAQTESRSATVYRCGKDGRELRDAPCPANPKATAEQVAYDQPSAADEQAARQLAARDAKQADALQKDRLKQEAEQRRRTAAAGRMSPAAAPAQPASAPQLLVTKRPKLKRPHKPKVTAG